MTTFLMVAAMSPGFSKERSARFIPRRTSTNCSHLFAQRSIMEHRRFIMNCSISRSLVPPFPWPSLICWIGYLIILTNQTLDLTRTSFRRKRRYIFHSSKTQAFIDKTKMVPMFSALLPMKKSWSSGTHVKSLWQRQWIVPAR